MQSPQTSAQSDSFHCPAGFFTARFLYCLLPPSGDYQGCVSEFVPVSKVKNPELNTFWLSFSISISSSEIKFLPLLCHLLFDHLHGWSPLSSHTFALLIHSSSCSSSLYCHYHLAFCSRPKLSRFKFSPCPSAAYLAPLAAFGRVPSCQQGEGGPLSWNPISSHGEAASEQPQE